MAPVGKASAAAPTSSARQQVRMSITSSPMSRERREHGSVLSGIRRLTSNKPSTINRYAGATKCALLLTSIIWLSATVVLQTTTNEAGKRRGDGFRYFDGGYRSR